MPLLYYLKCWNMQVGVRKNTGTPVYHGISFGTVHTVVHLPISQYSGDCINLQNIETVEVETASSGVLQL